ncbi:hypothetical protein RHMOL_Rhmol06G0202500 [Rhododendron molle]|uniref:Uncharacterized protein n=1 Tax=Rhododendron molle TaxID=49168 RepID=A0ACC0NGD8_RHOML|nr:hypothetical protein RHMOL_Rhmol06G0202500 [Rhododendron molle]
MLIQSRFDSSGVSHISALEGRASADSTNVARHFLWSGVLFSVRVGFRLIFLFGLLVFFFFFCVSRFLPICGASLTPAWVVLLLSTVLCLFGVEGLVGVGCSLWTKSPPFDFLILV